VAALRELVWAQLEAARMNHARALAHLDAAERARPGTPIVLLRRGEALVGLERWNEACNCLEEYRGTTEDSLDILLPLGLAYRRLGQQPQADEVYRKLCDKYPKHPEALFGQLVSPGPVPIDLAERFARLPDPAGSFDYVAEALAAHENYVSLLEFCQSQRREGRTSPSLHFYEGIAHAAARSPEKATASFRQALRAQPNKETRKGWRARAFKALLMPDQPERAYPFADDHHAFFRRLVGVPERLSTERLVWLINQHAARHPDDPLIPLFRALVLARDDKFQEADEAFRRALANPEAEKAKDIVRATRVRVKYNLGRAMEAYREIGPAKDTFEQLAILVEDDAPEELAALIKAHEAKHPDGAELWPARCMLLVRLGKFDDATNAFRRALPTVTGEARRVLLQRFLLAMKYEGRAVQAYLAAPDPREAMALLTWPRFSHARPPWLGALVAAHKKRDPDDPELPLAEAAILEGRMDWAGAAAILEPYWVANQGNFPSPWTVAHMAEVMARAGRFARAVELLRGYDLEHLAPPLIEQRRGPELLRLALAMQRGSDSFHGTELEALAWLFMNRPKRALAAQRRLFADKHAIQALNDHLVLAFVERGLEREAWLASGRSKYYLDIAGRILLKKQKAVALLRLAEEHLKAFPNSTTAHGLLSKVYMARRDVRQAEWHHRRARKDEDQSADESWFVVAKNQAAKYAADNPDSVELLVHYCIELKDARQLHQLAAQERKRQPGSSLALSLDAYALLVAGQPAEAARLIQANRAVIFRRDEPGNWLDRVGLGSLLIRCLVKAGKLAEARRELDWLRSRRCCAATSEMLVHASAGDVKDCLQVMATHWGSHDLPRSGYDDPDLGPLLRGPAFAAFRKRYPEPLELNGP
jgi:predicted Zn-dependent protease